MTFKCPEGSDFILFAHATLCLEAQLLVLPSAAGYALVKRLFHTSLERLKAERLRVVFVGFSLARCKLPC